MEVIIRCVECDTDHEEYKIEVAHGSDAIIKIVPCANCIESARAEVAERFREEVT